MKGSIAISKILVDNNALGWGVFDFFKLELKAFTELPSAGWYAYKLIDAIYYFYWCDLYSRPTKKYLKALKEDGWNMAMYAAKDWQWEEE